MASYKVLGSGEEQVEVNGEMLNTGDVVELTEDEAAEALAASKIAPVEAASTEAAPAVAEEVSEDDEEEDEDEDEVEEKETI